MASHTLVAGIWIMPAPYDDPGRENVRSIWPDDFHLSVVISCSGGFGQCDEKVVKLQV